MQQPLKEIIIILVMFWAGISGCANLHAINDFSSASLTGITKFEDVKYSFTQHCMERCVADFVSSAQIKRSAACNCEVYKKADTVTLLIYNAIRCYFDGMAHLSDNKLEKYNFDVLNSALTEGSFADIKIGKEQVTAYSSIAQIILNATTGIYRRNKIKKYIEEANSPIQILLEKFQFILQKNLAGELDFKKEKLYDYYRELAF